MSDIKKEKILLDDLCPTIRAVTESGGEFLLYPNGESMLPTIKAGRDAVLLRRADTLRVGDLILYQRKGGAFVLHRIIRIDKGGSLVMRGDNQFYNEYGVIPSSVIAKVSAIIRGSKKISTTSCCFRARSKARLMFYPLRKLLFRAQNKIKRMLGGKNNG